MSVYLWCWRMDFPLRLDKVALECLKQTSFLLRLDILEATKRLNYGLCLIRIDLINVSFFRLIRNTLFSYFLYQTGCVELDAVGWGSISKFSFMNLSNIWCFGHALMLTHLVWSISTAHHDVVDELLLVLLAQKLLHVQVLAGWIGIKLQFLVILSGIGRLGIFRIFVQILTICQIVVSFRYIEVSIGNLRQMCCQLLNVVFDLILSGGTWSKGWLDHIVDLVWASHEIDGLSHFLVWLTHFVFLYFLSGK